MKFLCFIAVLLGAHMGVLPLVWAQDSPPLTSYQFQNPAQIDQLLGPIALYPDPLIAQILRASTVPMQIVLANRYVAGGGDPNRIDQQPWDSSVQALARYPSVLKWMDDNANWTTELGQVFASQPADVMSSIQRLRALAHNLGNLQSTPQQQVMISDGNIEIVPTDPLVIYVPVYQPRVVYYQTGYGTPFITFGTGFAIGGWLDYDFDWGNRNIIYWSRSHPRPPNWWHEPSRQRNYNQATVWHSNHHPVDMPVHQGDRGYGVPHNQPLTAPANRPEIHPVAPRQSLSPSERANGTASRSSTGVAHPTPAPVQHSQPGSRQEPNSAFIGIQNPRDTKAFSNRGQQSLRQSTPAAPVSLAPPAKPSGDRRGNNSNDRDKH